MDRALNFSEDDVYYSLMNMQCLPGGIGHYDVNLLSTIADDVRRYLVEQPLVPYKNGRNPSVINEILRLFDIFLDGMDVVTADGADDDDDEDEDDDIGIFSERRYFMLISYIVITYKEDVING